MEELLLLSNNEKTAGILTVVIVFVLAANLDFGTVETSLLNDPIVEISVNEFEWNQNDNILTLNFSLSITNGSISITSLMIQPISYNNETFFEALDLENFDYSEGIHIFTVNFELPEFTDHTLRLNIDFDFVRNGRNNSSKMSTIIDLNNLITST